MKSKAATVDEYLAEVDPTRLPVLTELRRLCLKMLPGYSEGMQWGMPCYSNAAGDMIAFSSQKNYIAFYGVPSVLLDAHNAQLPDRGKGCIYFGNPKKVDLALLEQLLAETLALRGEA